MHIQMSSALSLLTQGPSVLHAFHVAREISPTTTCGCSSVVEHLLAKERVESSNLFIRLIWCQLFTANGRITHAEMTYGLGETNLMTRRGIILEALSVT